MWRHTEYATNMLLPRKPYKKSSAPVLRQKEEKEVEPMRAETVLNNDSEFYSDLRLPVRVVKRPEWL